MVAAPDPDGLVDRTRTRYALALIGYALVNLAISVPPAVAVAAHFLGIFNFSHTNAPKLS